MASANEIIEKARGEGRTVLTEMESKELLKGLGIPTTEMRLAVSEQEAVAVERGDRVPVRAQGVLPGHQPQERRRRGQGGPQGRRRGRGRRLRGHHGLVPGRVPRRRHRRRDGAEHGEAGRGGHRGHGHRPAVRPGAHVRPGRGVGGTAQGRQLQDRPAHQTRRGQPPSATSRAARLLEGFRGSDPVDKGALEDILLRVSEFVAKTPEVAEMDLNPIFAYADGAVAVDARVILGGVN